MRASRESRLCVAISLCLSHIFFFFSIFEKEFKVCIYLKMYFLAEAHMCPRLEFNSGFRYKKSEIYCILYEGMFFSMLRIFRSGLAQPCTI